MVILERSPWRVPRVFVSVAACGAENNNQTHVNPSRPCDLPARFGRRWSSAAPPSSISARWGCPPRAAPLTARLVAMTGYQAPARPPGERWARRRKAGVLLARLNTQSKAGRLDHKTGAIEKKETVHGDFHRIVFPLFFRFLDFLRSGRNHQYLPSLKRRGWRWRRAG